MNREIINLADSDDEEVAVPSGLSAHIRSVEQRVSSATAREAIARDARERDAAILRRHQLLQSAALAAVRSGPSAPQVFDLCSSSDDDDDDNSTDLPLYMIQPVVRPPPIRSPARSQPMRINTAVQVLQPEPSAIISIKGERPVEEERKIKRQRVSDSNPKDRYFIKREYEPKGFGEADIPGELEEIACAVKEEKGNSATSSLSSIDLTRTGDSSSNGDEIEFCGGNMNVLSDMPHQREACSGFKFIPYDRCNNMRYCNQCYCYICDIIAKDCLEWSEHCNASHRIPAFKAEHNARKSKALLILSPQLRAKFFLENRALLLVTPTDEHDYDNEYMSGMSHTRLQNIEAERHKMMQAKAIMLLEFSLKTLVTVTESTEMLHQASVFAILLMQASFSSAICYQQSTVLYTKILLHSQCSKSLVDQLKSQLLVPGHGTLLELMKILWDDDAISWLRYDCSGSKNGDCDIISSESNNSSNSNSNSINSSTCSSSSSSSSSSSTSSSSSSNMGVNSTDNSSVAVTQKFTDKSVRILLDAVIQQSSPHMDQALIRLIRLGFKGDARGDANLSLHAAFTVLNKGFLVEENRNNGDQSATSSSSVSSNQNQTLKDMVEGVLSLLQSIGPLTIQSPNVMYDYRYLVTDQLISMKALAVTVSILMRLSIAPDVKILEVFTRQLLNQTFSANRNPEPMLSPTFVKSVLDKLSSRFGIDGQHPSSWVLTHCAEHWSLEDSYSIAVGLSTRSPSLFPRPLQALTTPGISSDERFSTMFKGEENQQLLSSPSVLRSMVLVIVDSMEFYRYPSSALIPAPFGTSNPPLNPNSSSRLNPMATRFIPSFTPSPSLLPASSIEATESWYRDQLPDLTPPSPTSLKIAPLLLSAYPTIENKKLDPDVIQGVQEECLSYARFIATQFLFKKKLCPFLNYDMTSGESPVPNLYGGLLIDFLPEKIWAIWYNFPVLFGSSYPIETGLEASSQPLASSPLSLYTLPFQEALFAAKMLCKRDPPYVFGSAPSMRSFLRDPKKKFSVPIKIVWKSFIDFMNQENGCRQDRAQTQRRWGQGELRTIQGWVVDTILIDRKGLAIDPLLERMKLEVLESDPQLIVYEVPLIVLSTIPQLCNTTTLIQFLALIRSLKNLVFFQDPRLLIHFKDISQGSILPQKEIGRASMMSHMKASWAFWKKVLVNVLNYCPSRMTPNVLSAAYVLLEDWTMCEKLIKDERAIPAFAQGLRLLTAKDIQQQVCSIFFFFLLVDNDFSRTPLIY
jgi:hypothetical protein